MKYPENWILPSLGVEIGIAAAFLGICRHHGNGTFFLRTENFRVPFPASSKPNHG